MRPPSRSLTVRGDLVGDVRGSGAERDDQVELRLPVLAREGTGEGSAGDVIVFDRLYLEVVFGNVVEGRDADDRT
ncbi:hypothetical protein [Roseicyclus marinus]|uniref:hypothetical protein n=1 Tax=Roseicyclus marinus TaxID=2161673 RepID=UPI00366D4267